MTDRYPYGNRRFRKQQSFLLFCALLVTVGTPNLNLFDTTGRVRGLEEFGFFNITYLWRLGVFFLAGSGATLVFLFALTRSRQGIPPLKGLGLIWLFYGWLTFTTALTAPDLINFSIASYRLLEWGMVLLITYLMLSGPPHEILRMFERFMRTVPLVALGVLAVVWLYNSKLPYSYSMQTQIFRLGGTAIHPNGLALLLGLGALFWFSTGRSSFRYPVVGLLLLACLLTFSRAGIFATAAAFFIYILLQELIYRQASTVKIAVLLLASSMIFVVSLSSFEILFNLALRGESLSYIRGAAGRADVWMATFELVKQSPIIGHGFIFGPKQLLYSPYIPSHWASAHAHNDFLNTLLAGGSVGGLLFFAIYFQAALHCIRQLRHHPLFIATFISLLIVSIFETNLSNAVGIRGVLFIMLLRTATITNSYQLVRTERLSTH